MNGYGQRWAPWSWAFVFSLVLWAIILGALAAALGGCAPLGFKHTIEANRGAGSMPGEAPVPPPATIPECKDSASLMCCCDMSTKGVINCRCPHPGGTVGTTP